jgi:hypothetical protein
MTRWRKFVQRAFFRMPLLPEWLLKKMARYLNRTMVLPKPGDPEYPLYYSFLSDELKALEPSAASSENGSSQRA